MTVLSFAESCRRVNRAASPSTALPPKQPGCERVLPLPSSLPARSVPEREGGIFSHGEPGLWRAMMVHWLDRMEPEPVIRRPLAIGA